ncbi:P-loop containing nucleoside triphosphate hydrolase protein [Syncephalis plumigaleata]|nr:P-loop containing nucleoside triphosphate hydrolase protein [Syncephalis plumigaleata]
MERPQPLLDELILLARDETTYTAVHQDINTLRDRLTTHYAMVHQGEELNCVMPNESGEQEDAAQPMKVHLKVLVALPVLRGSIDANTQIIVMAPSTLEEQSDLANSIDAQAIFAEGAESDGDIDTANEVFIMSRLFGEFLHFNLNLASSMLKPTTAIATAVSTPAHRSRVSSATTRRTPPSIPLSAIYGNHTKICTILSATKDIALEDNDYSNVVWANTLAMTRTYTVVYLQPALSFNLQLDMSNGQSTTLPISANLPVADAITVAGCSRVVKQNDIIHVRISEEQARIERSGNRRHDEATKDDVYFKVTKLSCSATEFDEQSRVPPRIPSHHVSTPEYDSLVAILRSGMHPWAAELQMRCTVLVTGVRGVGKRTLIANATDQLGVHLVELNCYELQSDTEAKTIAILKTHFDRAISFAPCVLLLNTLKYSPRRGLAKLTTAYRSRGHPIMVVATTDDVDALSTRLLGCFPQQIDLMVPDEQQRFGILSSLTEHVPLSLDVSLASIANQTAAFVAKDLKNIVHQAAISALERAKQTRVKADATLEDMDLARAGVQLTSKDFELALGQARASFSDSIGAPKIPNVTWDDVGGLANTIQLPLEHPELFASGVKKRSGVLFYGPPGTGKTLLAKAVATSCSLNFFSVKGPELLNMYIGESEANVRRVFQRARDARPCVIFFDELDSVAPKRGEKGDSGGVMDRIVSQLLAELDGMSDNGGGGGGDVFVIGATNRPDLLDPALLRPGRFDKLLYLGISEDHESQLNIIKALTRKFHLHPDLDLRQVAEQCPFNYTGADFYALCSDAMLKAMTRVAASIEQKVATINNDNEQSSSITVQHFLDHMATEEDIKVQVTFDDFNLALQSLVPSISMQELSHYKSVRDKFQQQSPTTTTSKE